MYIKEIPEQKKKSDRKLQMYDENINNIIKKFAKVK